MKRHYFQFFEISEKRKVQKIRDAKVPNFQSGQMMTITHQKSLILMSLLGKILIGFLPFFFFFFWLHWVFIALHWLLSGATLYLLSVGFSSHWLPLQQSMGSRAEGFSSPGSQMYMPHSVWSLSRPEIECVSPASVGKFLTTGPLRKPPTFHLVLFGRKSLFTVLTYRMGRFISPP